MWRQWRLVKGTELYDLAADFGQAMNVAAGHGDVVRKLRDAYEAWWAKVEPRLDDFSPISIGAEDNELCGAYFAYVRRR